MTGLEIMQAIVREELPHPTMTKSIPVKVMKVEKGKVVFNAIANNKHLNTHVLFMENLLQRFLIL